jgi:hypothetical protein
MHHIRMHARMHATLELDPGAGLAAAHQLAARNFGLLHLQLHLNSLHLQTRIMARPIATIVMLQPC